MHPPWHPARWRINALNAKRHRLIRKGHAPLLTKAVMHELANQAAIQTDRKPQPVGKSTLPPFEPLLQCSKLPERSPQK